MCSREFKLICYDQLVMRSLLWKANGLPSFSSRIFDDYDLYDGEEMWKNKFVGGEKKAYFFSKLKKKYVPFRGFIRVSANGIWRGYGREQNIVENGEVIGTKRRFKFEPKKSCSHEEERWLMVEYSLAGISLNKVKESQMVVCRVERKNTRQRRLRLRQQGKKENRRMEDLLMPLFSALSLQSNNEESKNDREMEEPLILPSFSTLSLGSNNETTT